MFRTILILAVLAPHALAQPAGAPESSPIEVTGLVSTIDLMNGLDSKQDRACS
jgi:hypothetical protein